jgi:hypothetical protein
MSSTSSSIAENRFVRRAVLAAGACLFVFGLTACGGSGGSPPSSPDYEAYCQKTKECVGADDFERFQGTIEQCAGSLAESVNTRMDACREVLEDSFKCSIENFTCSDQNNVSSPEECQEEQEAVDSAC